LEFISNKQGGRGNRNEVMRCVVAEVEVDEVAAAEQGGCKYGGCVGPHDEVGLLVVQRG